MGQDEAVAAVAACHSPEPSGHFPQAAARVSFIFVGPTGVGKTELVKVLAAELFRQRRIP